MTAAVGPILDDESVDDYIDRLVDAAPTWDELSIEQRNTLLQIFRPAAEARSA